MSYDVGVFISHSWAYTEHYTKLAEWLFDSPWNVNEVPIRFIDNSIPKYDPIHDADNEYELAVAIANEIAKAHVVVCPTGMYASYSKWIEKELIGATKMGRRILGVDPWGQQRQSSVVADRAHKTVGWNQSSVGGGVWDLYREM